MKKTLIVIGICSLYGCGLFQKVNKEKHSDDLNLQSGSEKNTNELDTSSKQTHESFKIRMHLFNKAPNAPLPSYQPPVIPGADPSSSLSGAMSDLKSENQQMQGMFGYLEAELNRFVQEKKGTSKQTKERDTVTINRTVFTSSKTKEPALSWIEIAGIVAALLLAKDLMTWLAGKVFKR